mgnify:FL=1
MKLYDVDDDGVKSILKAADFDNFFDVYLDGAGNYFFNLNSTLYIDVDKDQLPTYTCRHRSHWPLISYKIYGTTRYAWLLMKLNDVKAKDVFSAKDPGDIVYYIDPDNLEQIIESINQMD